MIPFKKPFKLDPWKVFVWDANGLMCADFSENEVRARGWGHILYGPSPEETMNQWESWLKEILGSETDPDKVVELMNQD